MAEIRKTSSIKSTETAKEVKTLVRAWYQKGREVKANGGHIAWLMYGAPLDLLLAMDVISYGAEQYSSACAAKQVALPYCEEADSLGYSQDICGYQRVGMGYEARTRDLGSPPHDAPYHGLPPADMLIGRTTCDAGYKWFQALQTHMKVPVFNYDYLLPWPDSGHYIQEPDQVQRYIAYYKQTMVDFVSFLEKSTGRRLDLDRLREIMKISQETRTLFYNIFQLRKATPCPLPTEDWMTCIFPFFTMTGTTEALGFYRRLYAEVKSKVDNHEGVLPNERLRLMWTGVPPWHNTWIFNDVHKYGAVFAVDYSYPPPPPVELDLADPLEMLARRAYYAGGHGVTCGWPVPGEDALGPFSGATRPVSVLLDLARDYKIDGIIMHHIKSCRLCVIGHEHAIRLLRDKYNVPVMQLETDMVDPRSFDEADIAARLESFIEVVQSRKESNAR